MTIKVSRAVMLSSAGDVVEREADRSQDTERRGTAASMASNRTALAVVTPRLDMRRALISDAGGHDTRDASWIEMCRRDGKRRR